MAPIASRIIGLSVVILIIFNFKLAYSQQNSIRRDCREYPMSVEELTIALDNPIELVQWHPQKRIIVGTSNGSILSWELFNGDLLEKSSNESNRLIAIDLNANGNLVASIDTDGQLQIRNLETSVTVLNFASGINPTALDWNTQGSMIATVNDGESSPSIYEDRVINIWSSETGELIKTLDNPLSGELYSVSFSPSGDFVAAATGYAEVAIWETSTWSVTNQLNNTSLYGGTLGDLTFAAALGWSPNGDRIAVINNNNVRDFFTVVIWDVETRELLAELDGNIGFLNGLQWNPQEDFLAVFGHDAAICVWDMVNYEPMFIADSLMNSVTSVSWSPDGKKLSSASWDGTIRIWEFE